MDRLTGKDKALANGKEIVVCNFEKDDCNDSCMYGRCKWIEKAEEKLKMYEDLEEQGLLIKLPCKKGDKVWCVDWYWDCGYSLHICPNPDFDCDAYRCGLDQKTFFVGMREFDIGMLEQFGKTVFLTREEAEQALRERSE